MERLGTVATQVNNERWVLGTFAEQNAVASQYDRLPSDLSDLYVKDYIQAWNGALAKLQMKPLVADKPRYLVLGAVAVPTSPLRMLFESLRDETALTKERPGLQKPATPPPAAGQPPVATPILYNQADIGNPAGRIEQAFRPFHEFVEGAATQRPIDLLIAKLGEIKDNLLTSANVPSQAGVANAALQVQVQNFRAQANRLPPPFGEMMTRAASSFDGDVTTSELAQLQRSLGDQVIGVCQQTTREKYPLTRGASSEISLSDFGRVFAPNGVMDGFFKQNLAKYADTSRATWSWRTDQPVGTRLSAGMLRSFQQAAQIRDAFFPTGGTSPNFTMQVLPPTIQFPGTVAKFEVNGATISTPGGPPPQPGVIQWPGAQTGHASVTLTADPLPPGSAPVSFERTGAWSLFRLLDAGGAAPRGDRVVATWSLGGQFLSYTLAVGGASNPLTLPALREFRCPTGL